MSIPLSQGSVRLRDAAADDDEYLAAVRARFVLSCRSAPAPFRPPRARCEAPAPTLLDAAAGGSVLHSDVDEMPRPVQGLLIGLLEELEDERDPAAAVRLVSGSTASLVPGILAGTFSAQLFYRLNVIHVVAGVGAT
jgi:Sigma-54 interaction domain